MNIKEFNDLLDLIGRYHPEMTIEELSRKLRNVRDKESHNVGVILQQLRGIGGLIR